MILTLAAAALLATSSTSGELPRRGGLGVALAPSAEGISIANVPEGSAGAQAGLREGDVLLGIDGRDITDWLPFQAASAGWAAGRPSTVTVTRDGEAVTLDVTPTPLPAPTLEGARVELGSVGEVGNRVRTVTLVPDEASTLSRGEARPAVFYVQGIPCQAIDSFANAQNYRVRLFQDLIDAGFIVGFADKPGVGDSEGEACLDGGFDREVVAFSEAISAFAARPDTDASRIYAVGVSMGGIQAPLVARDTDVAGIVTWGTGVSPWFDYIATNFRMRAVIQGQPAAEAEAGLRNLRLILSDLLIDEMSPDEVRALRPDAAQVFEASFGSMERFAGRHISFHQEIDDAPIWQAWQAFEGDLLALQGEFDWVASAHDHALAVEAVNLTTPGSGEFVIVEGLDHAMTAHETLADSFANTFQGTQNDRFHDAATRWLIEHASRR